MNHNITCALTLGGKANEPLTATLNDFYIIPKREVLASPTSRTLQSKSFGSVRDATVLYSAQLSRVARG